MRKTLLLFLFAIMFLPAFCEKEKEFKYNYLDSESGLIYHLILDENEKFTGEVEVVGWTDDVTELNIPGEIEIPLPEELQDMEDQTTRSTRKSKVTIWFQTKEDMMRYLFGNRGFIGSVVLGTKSAITSIKSAEGVGTTENFNDYPNLVTLYLPSTMKSVPPRLFAFNDKLEQIVIPNSVEEIGEGAFCYMENLKTVRFGNNLKAIGKKAFCYSGIEGDLALPNTLNSIGEQAFDYCENISSVSTGDNISEIAHFAFKGCRGIKSVKLGNSLKQLGAGAFMWCDSIQSITFPNNLTEIGDSCFYFCSLLKDLSLPQNLNCIGTDAFYACKKLEQISIPSKVKVIGDGAFSECKALKSINIPDNVQSIGKECFRNSGLNNINFSKSMTEIPERAFEYCDFEEISIPGNIRKIGMYAFVNNHDLTKINFEEGVDRIDHGAFSDCNNLEEITFPNSLSSIGKEAFLCTYPENKNPLKLIWGNNIKFIDDYAFAGDRNMESVTLPASLEKFGVQPFGRYLNSISNFTNIYVDESSPYFSSEDGILYNKDKTSILIYPDARDAKEFTIRSNVDSIGHSCFEGCISLKQIHHNNNIVKIGRNAFRHCTNLEEFQFPSELTDIKEMTFYECRNLKDLTLSPNIKTIGDQAFAYCSDLQSVRLNNGLESIGENAFEDCASLNVIDIPEGVKEIKGLAFIDCKNLSKVILPSTLELLGESKHIDWETGEIVNTTFIPIFWRIWNISEVYYKAENPVEVTEELFDESTYETATLFVKEEAIDKIKNTTPWNKFSDIRAFDFSGINETQAEINLSEKVEIYDLSGRLVSGSTDSLEHGIYIIRRGQNSRKVVIGDNGI